MKTRNLLQRRKAFTLVEMIGVLAIIAVLAVVIAPKVIGAIRSSRINATIVSIDSVKTAATEFVGKYGVLPTTNNNSRIDDLLRAQGLLDERFSSKIGLQNDTYATAGASWSRNESTGAWTYTGGASQANLSRIVCQTSTATNPDTATGRNFRLDGTANLPSGVRVLSAVLRSVPATEAYELSMRIDGESLSAENGVGADAKGKVVYRDPGTGGVTDVYVYMMHQ